MQLGMQLCRATRPCRVYSAPGYRAGHVWTRENEELEDKMNTEPDRLLLPQGEVRAVLGGISRTKVWELVNAGELVRVNIGTRSFITAKSVAAYVDRLTAAASA